MEERATLLREAKEDLAQGRAAEARAKLERVLRAHDGDAEALLGLAKVALYTEAYGEARALADRALSASPGLEEAHLLRALSIEAEGDAATALDHLRALTEQIPGSCLAHYHVGRLLAASGRSAEALRFAEHAVEIDAHRVELLTLLGWVQQQVGRRDDAERTYRKAIVRAPGRVEGYLGLADTLTERGELELALGVLAQARRSAGESADTWRKQALLLARQGDFKAAAQCAQRVSELRPDDARAWLDVAGLRLRAGEPAAAERAAQRACELAPESWQGHFQLGLVHDAQGRLQMAENAYRNAVKRGADSWEPANNLGLVLLARGGPQAAVEAERLFRQAAELAGDQAVGPTVNLAIALKRQDKADECRELCAALLGRELPPKVRVKVEELRGSAD